VSEEAVSRTHFNIRCAECGNAIRGERHPYDPTKAVERVTNECPICNAASGGFEECWYFDADGNELNADPEEFYG
jgi:hypothetical protein